MHHDAARARSHNRAEGSRGDGPRDGVRMRRCGHKSCQCFLRNTTVGAIVSKSNMKGNFESRSRTVG